MGTLWLFTLMFLILLVHPLYIGLRCTNHFSSSSLLKCQLLLSVEGRGGSWRGRAHLQAPGSLASSWNVVIYHYWFLIVDPNKSTDFLARCMATCSHVLFFWLTVGLSLIICRECWTRTQPRGMLALFLTHENGTGSREDLWSSGEITQAVSLSLQNSGS